MIFQFQKNQRIFHINTGILVSSKPLVQRAKPIK